MVQILPTMSGITKFPFSRYEGEFSNITKRELFSVLNLRWRGSDSRSSVFLKQKLSLFKAKIIYVGYG